MLLIHITLSQVIIGLDSIYVKETMVNKTLSMCPHSGPREGEVRNSEKGNNITWSYSNKSSEES